MRPMTVSVLLYTFIGLVGICIVTIHLYVVMFDLPSPVGARLREATAHIRPSHNNVNTESPDRLVLAHRDVQSNETEMSSKPILTLFTTFKDTTDRRRIQSNTLVNWRALGGGLRPLLFGSSRGGSTWTSIAATLGWNVGKTDFVNDTLPVLKWMFEAAEKANFETPFLGYANGDILFDDGLLETLETVRKSVINFTETPILITGRRRNVNVSYIPKANCLKCLSRIAQFTPLFSTDAQDYFIVSRAGFPWERVPEFVIGRPGFDNWLVAMAREWDIMVIDTSETVNAVHQVGIDGVLSGWNFTDDPFVNHRLVPGFDYSPGHTCCAEWRTLKSYDCPGQNNTASCVKVSKRYDAPSWCSKTDFMYPDLSDFYYDVRVFGED